MKLITVTPKTPTMFSITGWYSRLDANIGAGADVISRIPASTEKEAVKKFINKHGNKFAVVCGSAIRWK